MEQELLMGAESGGGGGGGAGAGLHVVALPYPLQGHMAPMLELCHLLAARGISVSFVHQDSNLTSLHFSQPQHAPPSIRHISLPLSLPGKASSSSASSTRSRVLASEQLLASFSLLLTRLHASTKVSCVIADVLMSWALPAATEMGILGASLWTAGLSSFAAYCNIPLLALEGVFPIKAMEGGAQQLIRCIPGLPQIFHFADLPSFFHAPSWPDDVLDFITRQVQHMTKSTWVLSNHACVEPEMELEQEMGIRFPILSIGPLLTLQHHHFLDAQTPCPHLNTHNTRASLWHEDLTCLEWLHGRPSLSVLYISFGSVVALSPLQFQEILLGLQTSQQSFLWALRPDAVEGVCNTDGETLYATTESQLLLRKTKLGLIVPWAPQLDVLAHDSIGGFMTHCGWNSVMESIAMGKPMLGFPRFVEQKMNCRLLEHWHVGKELQVDNEGLLDRHEVESGVKSLMKEGNSFRKACAKLRTLVIKAISDDNGSSSTNLDTFVDDLRKRVS